MQLIDNKHSNESGVTLVELAIVLIIFGIMVTTLVLMNSTLAAVAGERDADGIAGNDPVLIGNLPLYGFNDGAGNPAAPRVTLRSLVTASRAEGRNVDDPWNFEFTYAVSQLLTNAGTFDSSMGVIRITDEWARDTGGTASDAQYVVLSRGQEDRSGCIPDVFNRDINGKVFIGPPISYNAAKPNNLKLDVVGDIFAETRIASDLICDSDGVTCFRPESLYNLSCPNLGEYMSGVQIDGANNLTAVCDPITFIPANDTCPPGSFVNGIYTNGGNLVCEN